MWYTLLSRIGAWLLDTLIRSDRRWQCRHLAACGVWVIRHIPGGRRLFPVTSEAVGSVQAQVRSARFMTTLTQFTPLQSRTLLAACMRVPLRRAFQRRTALRGILLLLPSPCHLNCPGCFFERFAPERGLDPVALHKTLVELKANGVYLAHVIGHGELLAAPQMAEQFLDTVAAHTDMFFTLFTSGAGITPALEQRICTLDNLFILISIDGLAEEHNRRRGPGVWENGMALMSRLTRQGKLCGFSCTVTHGNWREVSSQPFIEALCQYGACFGIYFRQRHSGDPRWDFGSEFVAEYHRAFVPFAEAAPIPIVDQELYEEQHGCRVAGKALLTVDMAANALRPCVTCDKQMDVPFDPQQPGALTAAIPQVFARTGWQHHCACMNAAGETCAPASP